MHEIVTMAVTDLTLTRVCPDRGSLSTICSVVIKYLTCSSVGIYSQVHRDSVAQKLHKRRIADQTVSSFPDRWPSNLNQLQHNVLNSQSFACFNTMVNWHLTYIHCNSRKWSSPTRNGAPETCMFQYISCMFQNISCMEATFMHVSCMKHYFHAWNMHEPCKVQKLVYIALHKTRMTGIPWYHAWNMHEVLHYIILIRSSCFADLKKYMYETLTKLQCTKYVAASLYVS